MTLFPLPPSPDATSWIVEPPPDQWVWLIGRDHGPHLMITGPSEATRLLVGRLIPSLRDPIHHVACDTLPRGFPHGGTLLLENLQDLDGSGQAALLQWCDEPGAVDTQVIALTQVPLYARVQDGTFLDSLYYRLNVIHVTARLV